jgi:tetratricopeptide (TPR) repeat protein
LTLYQNAIDLNPDELIFYTNKAAVHFELKEYDKCIDLCDTAIEKSKGGNYDYVKLGKALARKALAYL